jgi:hypothetical protein
MNKKSASLTLDRMNDLGEGVLKELAKLSLRYCEEMILPGVKVVTNSSIWPRDTRRKERYRAK